MMSKMKERERKRGKGKGKGKGERGRPMMMPTKCWLISLGREEDVDGGYGRKKKKKKGNLGTKYAIGSECIKNI